MNPAVFHGGNNKPFGIDINSRCRYLFYAKTPNIVNKVNLEEKLALFNEHWSPKIVGTLNGQHVKLAKLKGEFIWHAHENEDELFMVIRGSLTIRFRDRDVILNEGEFFIVPRGVEHKPVAEEEVHVLFFEPASTLNTGNVESDKTVAQLDHI